MSLTNVTSISASLWDTLALKKDGKVWTWGANGSQIISGELIKESTPQKIIQLKNVSAIAGGSYRDAVLNKEGKVWAWQKNNETGMPREMKYLSDTNLIAS